MKGSLYFLVIISVAILAISIIHAIRYIRRVIYEHGQLRAEREQLKAQNQAQQMRIMYQEDRHSLWIEMKEELVTAWKAMGVGQGFAEAPEAWRSLAAETGKAKAQLQIQSDNVANYRAQLHQEWDATRQLTGANQQLQAQRDEAKARLQKAEDELRELRKQASPKTPTPPQEAAQTRPQGVPGPSAGTQISVPDAYGTDFEPEILEYEEHPHYELRDVLTPGKKWQGLVEIRHKLLDQTEGKFSVTDLVPGTVHYVQGTNLKVLRCALPSCYKVKITSQPSAKCCSREHTRELEKIKRHA